MVNILYCEILKLKRSNMLLISFLGALVTPLMSFIGNIKHKINNPGETVMFSEMFSETNQYILLLIGLVLYGLISAYLFTREYSENTLKSIIIIPVSKMKFILGKYIMLFLWIIVLTAFSWISTLVLGLIIQLEGLNLSIILKSLIQFFKGGCLIFLVTTPFVFVALWFKKLEPVIVLSAVITLGNFSLLNDDFVALYPWSAIYVLSDGERMTKYPLSVSFTIVIIVSVLGFLASLAYFKKSDIY